MKNQGSFTFWTDVNWDLSIFVLLRHYTGFSQKSIVNPNLKLLVNYDFNVHQVPKYVNQA